MGKTQAAFQSFITEALRQRMQVMSDQVEALEEGSVDGVHDMRVASRRMRAALRELRPWLPGKKRKGLRGQVREVTRLLGRPRELDVMIGMLDAYQPGAREEESARACAMAVLRAARAGESPKCIRALEIVQSEDLRRDYARLLKNTGDADSQSCKTVKENLLAHFRKLHDKYAIWDGEGGEEKLHQLRIAFKKFRYACEIFTPLYGGSMKEYTAKLKEQQQLLGRWNDCRVLRDELKDIHGDPAPDMKPLIKAFDKRCDLLFKTYVPAGESFFSTAEWRKGKRLIRKTLQ